MGSSYGRRDFVYDCIIFITHGLSWVRALHALLEGGFFFFFFNYPTSFSFSFSLFFLLQILNAHRPQIYLLVESICEPPDFFFCAWMVPLVLIN